MTDKIDPEKVRYLVERHPRDWNPLNILAAQSLLRQAYLKEEKAR